MVLLDMPSTTFYREVEAGNIPYKLEKGRKRGMLFPKEAIEVLAHMKKRARKKLAHHSFTRTTNADIWTAFEADLRTYGEEDSVPYRRSLEWREINDEISMAIKEDGQLVGYATLLPLEEHVIHLLLHDKIRERDILPSAVKKWSEPHLSVYIASIVVEPSADKELTKERGLFLLRHTIKWAITLTHQHDVKNWYAMGVTPLGQSMLERLGFQETVSLEEGKRKGYVLREIQKPSSKIINQFLAEMESQHLPLTAPKEEEA